MMKLALRAPSNLLSRQGQVRLALVASNSRPTTNAHIVTTNRDFLQIRNPKIPESLAAADNRARIRSYFKSWLSMSYGLPPISQGEGCHELTNPTGVLVIETSCGRMSCGNAKPSSRRCTEYSFAYPVDSAWWECGGSSAACSPSLTFLHWA